jgi:hypothetical protein
MFERGGFHVLRDKLLDAVPIGTDIEGDVLCHLPIQKHLIGNPTIGIYKPGSGRLRTNDYMFIHPFAKVGSKTSIGGYSSVETRL